MPRAARPKAKKADAPIAYSVHPGVAMVQKWVNELKAKTGRTLEEWCAYITKEGPDELAGPPRVAQGRSTSSGRTRPGGWPNVPTVSRPGTRARSPTWPLPRQYVDEMFSGPKADLRPLGDALMRLGREVAADIKFCPCKTIIPFYREHVIAEIKPATRTRIDFGLALGPDIPFTARLKDTEGIEEEEPDHAQGRDDEAGRPRRRASRGG